MIEISEASCDVRAVPFFRDLSPVLRNEIGARAVARASCRPVSEVAYIPSETVFRSVCGRVVDAKLLRLYLRGAGGAHTIHLTHQEKASLVDYSTRHTTTSVLHGMRKAGLLEMAGCPANVLDPEVPGQIAQQPRCRIRQAASGAPFRRYAESALTRSFR